MKRHRYDALGFSIESELPLPAAPTDSSPRFRIRLAERELSRPSDTGVLAQRDSGPARHTIQRADGGYLLTFSSHARLFVDEALTSMDVQVGPTGNTELASLLVIGVGLAFVATLDGGLVLHASAVAGPAGLWAFVGPAGAGKSTAAALLARAGAGIVSDDALRVDQRGDRFVGSGAGTELRLRPNAAALGDAIGPVQQRSTSDGRIAFSAPRAEPGERPLACVFVPRLGAAPGRCVVARPADAHEGAVQLLRALRVGTWRDPAILERQTRAVAALVRSVPVQFLDLPTPPPTDWAFAADVARAVGM